MGTQEGAPKANKRESGVFWRRSVRTGSIQPAAKCEARERLEPKITTADGLVMLTRLLKSKKGKRELGWEDTPNDVGFELLHKQEGDVHNCSGGVVEAMKAEARKAILDAMTLEGEEAGKGYQAMGKLLEKAWKNTYVMVVLEKKESSMRRIPLGAPEGWEKEKEIVSPITSWFGKIAKAFRRANGWSDTGAKLKIGLRKVYVLLVELDEDQGETPDQIMSYDGGAGPETGWRDENGAGASRGASTEVRRVTPI
jgi:hypothetical protein